MARGWYTDWDTAFAISAPANPTGSPSHGFASRRSPIRSRLAPSEKVLLEDDFLAAIVMGAYKKSLGATKIRYHMATQQSVMEAKVVVLANCASFGDPAARPAFVLAGASAAFWF